jgi:L-lactate dehydrogenase complex protein LldG
MSSRDHILGRLRAAPQPYPDYPPVGERRPMIPLSDTAPEVLLDRFTLEAKSLSCVVTRFESDANACQHIQELLEDDTAVMSWDFAHIPLPGLAETLQAAGIRCAEPDDAQVRVGLTGVDAVLAATGSLVIGSGPGKARQAFLLPPVHIAVVAASQVVADLESWMTMQRTQGLEQFRTQSSVLVVSGPSRTADIGMELVMGAHGPAELHVILMTGQ